jgi:uncharacterized membrane protein
MKTLRWLLVTLAIATATHFALLYFGPAYIMSIAMGRMTTQAGGVNKIYFAPRPNAQNNRIVRSSPDLLYSVCVYDVSAKPLSIRADVPPGTYWSASFYDMNTNNYRVINDGQATAGSIVVILTKAGSTTPSPAGAEAIVSPTDRGIILFRTLVAEDARFAEIDAARRQAKCAPL